MFREAFPRLAPRSDFRNGFQGMRSYKLETRSKRQKKEIRQLKSCYPNQTRGIGREGSL